MKVLTPYKKLLSMGKEAIQDVLAIPRAHSALKKAELELAKLEEQVATLETELTTICSKTDLDFTEILKKLDDIAWAERRQRQMTKVINEMFPQTAK